MGLLLTACSFAAAFGYQAGYLSHFGLPPELAEVGARELVLSAAAILGSGFVFLTIVSGVLDMLPKSVRMWPESVRTRLSFTALLFFFLLIVAIHLHTTKLEILAWVAIPGLMLTVELTAPLVAYRHIPTYAGKLQASVDADRARQRNSDSLTQGIVRLLTPGIAAVVVVTAFVCLFAYSVGKSTAHDQEVFLVAATEKPCVVIRILSSGMLCVRYIPGSPVTLGEYRILPPEAVSLTLIRTGPLFEADPEQLPNSGKH